jgi:tRNA pseudouridine32 synthase/23S rRNA pseudouridine746 synthase
MMGVLLVRSSEGVVGYLRGFAGMLGRRRVVEGFVPPAFDVDHFEELWNAGSPEISRLDKEIEDLRQRQGDGPELARARAEQVEFSRALHSKLYATYRIRNAAGQSLPLPEFFSPRLPPGGSGDCAAVKLIARAHELRARPLALAEFWWGSPPPAGGRQEGVFYPACRGRCAKLLPFMLEGIECEAAPDFGIKVVPDDAPEVIFEDDDILVVVKPAGLLSVPGRGPRRQDCVERRLQQRAQLDDPSWPRLVHRLDLATSGILIAAKRKTVYVELQKQFSRQTIRKRYVAVVRGVVEAHSGVIDLPLTRDLDDRPRQMVDFRHGKASVTEWRVLERSEARTRVLLVPKTGRTHQLRLHAAHEAGLGLPIEGDWIYGFGGERLLLHAEGICFVHPRSGEPIDLRAPCPF